MDPDHIDLIDPDLYEDGPPHELLTPAFAGTSPCGAAREGAGRSRATRTWRR